jgi:ATP-binding cassette subfamily B (MDR/TAP) protein 1
MGAPQDEKSGLEASSAQAQRQQQGTSPWNHLFAFTTPKQYGTIVGAVATACVVAAGKTIYTVLLGKIFDIATKYGSNLLGGQDTLAQISQWCGYLTVLGVAMWLLSSIDMALWITSGELRAVAAKNTLFATMIQKEMDWFDLRGDGMASMAIQTQG